MEINQNQESNKRMPLASPYERIRTPTIEDMKRPGKKDMGIVSLGFEHSEFWANGLKCIKNHDQRKDAIESTIRKNANPKV